MMTGGYYCMDVFTILYFLCGIIYVIIGVFTLLNDSKNQSNKLFFIVCINLAVWAILYFLMNSSSDVNIASKFYLYATFCWAFNNCLFLHFIVILGGKEGLFNRPFKYVVFYFPAIVCIYLYVFQPQQAQDFVKINLGWVILQAKNRGFIWTNFYNMYYFVYMLAVIFSLFMWWKNSKIIRERKQAIIILMTFLIAVITGAITDIMLPALQIRIIPSIGIILVIIPIIGIWYSIKKYKLMDLNPENFALEVLKIYE